MDSGLNCTRPSKNKQRTNSLNYLVKTEVKENFKILFTKPEFHLYKEQRPNKK